MHLISLPRFAPIAEEDLIGLLAAQQRHLTCVAIPHRMTLSVGWWPTDPADADGHRRSAQELLAGVDRRRNESLANGHVLLAAGTERLRISKLALREFMLNYYLPFVDLHFQLGAKEDELRSQELTLHVSSAAFDAVKLRLIT
jgi:hypothetical protein